MTGPGTRAGQAFPAGRRRILSGAAIGVGVVVAFLADVGDAFDNVGALGDLARRPLVAAGWVDRSAPLAWTVAPATTSELNICHTWTFTRPLDRVPLPTADEREGLNGWAREQRGIDNDSANYTVAVRGTGSEAVVLRGLRVRVLSRGPARTGVSVANGTGCGGAVTARYYVVDLDVPSPRLEFLGAYAGAAAPVDRAYRVSSADPEYFLLSAVTDGPPSSPGFYSFVYEIDWSSGDESGTVTVSAPDGKPFEVNRPKQSQARYVPGGRGWEPAGMSAVEGAG